MGVYNTDGVTLCENKAQELLEKEKQIITNAYERGWDVGVDSTPVPEPNAACDAEKYFTETFNQNK